MIMEVMKDEGCYCGGNRSRDGIFKALADGTFGRCVYHCDNDMNDTKIINMLYENGVTVSFWQTAYTDECYRSLHITGTKGEIRGKFEDNSFTVTEFATGNHCVYDVSTVSDMHGGGDYFMMTDFIKLIREGKVGGRTEVKNAVDSHVMCFAAEESQLNCGAVIDLKEYAEKLRGNK